MNSELKRLFEAAEGRWYSDVEEEQLRGYADGILSRIDTYQAVARAERAILETAYTVIRQRIPRMEAMHGADGFDKATRDLGQTLRYANMSMLMKEPDFVHDKLAVWIRTILFALSDRQNVIMAFEAMADACRKHLTAADADQILPYVNVVVDELRGTANGLAAERDRKAA
ncbi:MAG: hypothetical protein AAGH15_16340 [Myxococcota bacterium]